MEAGLSLKTMQTVRRERDERLRERYWTYISRLCIKPHQLMFGDETSLDGRDLRRVKGWGAVGAPVSIRDIFHRGRRISILAVYSYSGHVEFDYVEGSYNTESFMRHILKMIQARMQPIPNPNSILVLDNCRIHKVEEDYLRSFCNHLGGDLVFLAPYSPVDSPVEKVFNACKHRWMADSEQLQSLRDTKSAIRRCFYNCTVGHSSDTAERTYASCGYHYDSHSDSDEE